MLISTVFFGLMAVTIRYASRTLPTFEIAFFRNFFGLVAVEDPGLDHRLHDVEDVRRPGAGDRGHRVLLRLRHADRGADLKVGGVGHFAADRAVFEQYLDEASFETHIGAEYGVIFNQQLSSLIEEGESQLTWLTKFDPP